MSTMLLMFRTFLLSSLLIMATSCRKQYPPTDMTQNSIVPKPVSVTAAGGTFALDDDAAIYVDAGDDALLKNAGFLANFLRNTTGYDLEIRETEGTPWRGNIFLTSNMHNDSVDVKGSYVLNITEKLITVSSSTPEGIFYGIQTLRQLLPADIEKPGKREAPLLLPTGTIRDWPQYGYRGEMLDVARHFFDVPTVKRVIDYLALYKMNVLHLHLSDDQGWRIEIDAWPNLTMHGGSTEVGGGEGGFYTKDDYRDIVNYAADRYITIIPEIDMPGHTNAALASYPGLNCDGKSPELYTGTRVGFSTLCTSKDIVYKFVDDVVREISEITPGPWFHIGGDEAKSTKHDDYLYFVNRVRKIVKSYGKQMIGWDEVANANVDGDDVIQFWAKEKNVLQGLQKGTKVILSPSKHAYLDIKYDSTTVLGLTWAGLTDVPDAYNWNPQTLVDGLRQKDILGIEAPLWSETIDNLDDIEFLMFPRVIGLAEIGWSAPENKSWDAYKVRLGKQKERMEALGINYYQSPKVPWQEQGDFFVMPEPETDNK
jgi:hexosaminidase